MKKRPLGIAIASIVLLGACSGTAQEQEEAPGQDEAGSATGGACAAAADLAASGADGAEEGTTTLYGMVGTQDDPEAFEICLVSEDGQQVTSLPAGDYTIVVEDPATLHNFHLTGGSVDESTSVPETEQATFEVTLEPGEYTYVCDPHPPMTGTFTVT